MSAAQLAPRSPGFGTKWLLWRMCVKRVVMVVKGLLVSAERERVHSFAAHNELSLL